MREVTERDLRMPEFRDAKPEDLEFREDGKLVRKDRWEVALRNVVSAIGWSRREFEVHEVSAEVRRIKELADANVKVKVKEIKALKAEAREVFDNPECAQATRDVIEWFASSIDTVLADDAGVKGTTRRQYYYRVLGCTARDAKDAECICWHDQGTGPWAQAKPDDMHLEWRDAPAGVDSVDGSRAS